MSEKSSTFAAAKVLKQPNNIMKKIFLMVLSAAVLAMPMMAQERPSENMIGDGSYEQQENVQTIAVPQTIAEAVAALPALPTVAQISSASAKSVVDARTYTPYKEAIQQTMLILTQQNAGIQARIRAAQQKQQKRSQGAMQQYQSNVNAGLMPSQEEMMALYMSGEIKETMSDEQMMDVMAGKFAQKWGVSKQEYLKIIGMAQSNPKGCEAYIKANHPQLYQRLYAANAPYGKDNVVADDSRDPEFSRIGGELTELQSQLLTGISVYSGNGVQGRDAQTYGSAYTLLYNQMLSDWKTSAEAKQIDEIETKLWERVEEWLTTLNAEGDEVTYPGWWTEERKKENAIIDQWNQRYAERWLKTAADGEKLIKGAFEKIATLETENAQLGAQGDQENMLYLMNLQVLNTLSGMLLQLTFPYQDALRFPCIEHQPETGGFVMEKGGKG